ncbi:hypothetical protein H5T56_04205 [Candidatus Bipolaricaulota bacterium]|nr:hypothetical protein [Candidatus Bipolaricaulota bacterium]
MHGAEHHRQPLRRPTHLPNVPEKLHLPHLGFKGTLTQLQPLGPEKEKNGTSLRGAEELRFHHSAGYLTPLPRWSRAGQRLACPRNSATNGVCGRW